MEIRRQLAIVRSRLLLILIVAVAAAGIGYGVAALSPRVYEGRATILIGQSLSAVNPDINDLLTSQRLTVTYASLATRRPILEKVIQTLGLSVTPEDLANQVFAEPSQTTAFLTIAARSVNPAHAAAIANEVANEVIAASPTVSGQQVELLQAIEEDLQATRTDIEAASEDVQRLQAIDNPTPDQRADLLELQDRLTRLRSNYVTLLSFASANGANLLTLVEQAQEPTEPSSPGRFTITLLAGVLGLMLALAAVFIAEYINDSLKRPEEVEEAIGLPTLGAVGRLRGDRGVNEIYRLVTLLNPRSHAAETYRSIRANIDFTSVDLPLRTLLVVSATAHEGKTVTAANLAVVFAEAGRRVLLVDADLRVPGVHSIFSLPNQRGFTSLVLDQGLDPDEVIQSTQEPYLHVLTSGPHPPNPAEILGAQRTAAILERLAAAFDLVVIDSPPLQSVADAAILSSRADGTLLVIDAKSSRRQSVVRARDTLARAGARVIGVVLNRVSKDVDADAYAAYGPVLARDLDAGGGAARG